MAVDPSEQRARALLDAAGYGPTTHVGYADLYLQGSPKARDPVSLRPELFWRDGATIDMPLRRERMSERFANAPLSTALGLNFKPRYYRLSKQNALIILHDDRPPTILPIDPAKPIADTAPTTSEEVWSRWRQQGDADLERMFQRKKPVRP